MSKQGENSKAKERRFTCETLKGGSASMPDQATHRRMRRKTTKREDARLPGERPKKKAADSFAIKETGPPDYYPTS